MSELSANAKKRSPGSFQDALEALDEALAKPSPTLSEIATGDLQNLQNEIKAKVTDFSKDTIAAMTDTSEILKALGREGVSQLAANGQEIAKDLSAQGKGLARSLDQKVRANPWLFIGGAAAAALVIGALVGSASARKSNDEVQA